MSGPRYHLVTGNFYARFEERKLNQQPEPDGDTIRFVPDNPFDLMDSKKFQRYGFRGPDVDEFGINIRFEGIDALETHYMVSGDSTADRHQNLALAQAARTMLLELLGFTNIVFGEGDQANKIVSVSNNPARGFVLANGIDGNGRLLGFVYGGPTGNVSAELAELEERGKPKSEAGPVVLGLPTPLPFFLTPDVMKLSINWRLIDAGLAYAELYTSLPLALLRVLAARVRELRRNPVANTIWSQETLGVNAVFIWDKRIETLEDKVIFPKIFRRFAQYAVDNQRKRQAFGKWLRDERYLLDRDDRLMLPPANLDGDPPFCEFGNLHDVLTIVEELENSLTLKLFTNPEDVIVLPDGV
jgi:hypothetical protein